MGDFLVEVHGWLRQDLAELRRQVDEIAEGTVGTGTSIERSVPDLGQAMRTHCLQFCEGLKKHHTGEDMGLFPELARQFPALAPALRKLGEEHVEVARLQEEITQLVEAYVPGESEPTQLRAELEVLTSQLEAHFDYEEKTVVTALNATAAAPNFG
jgi:hemerythrin-like domain-containing protein